MRISTLADRPNMAQDLKILGKVWGDLADKQESDPTLLEVESSTTNDVSFQMQISCRKLAGQTPSLYLFYMKIFFLDCKREC